MTDLQALRSPIISVFHDGCQRDAMQWTGSNWPDIVAFTGGCDMRGGRVYIPGEMFGAAVGDWFIDFGGDVLPIPACDVDPDGIEEWTPPFSAEEDEPAPVAEPGPFDDEAEPAAPSGDWLMLDGGPVPKSTPMVLGKDRPETVIPLSGQFARILAESRIGGRARAGEWPEAPSSAEAFRRAYPALAAMSSVQLERALRAEFAAAFDDRRRSTELMCRTLPVFKALGDTRLFNEINDYLRGQA